jgi:hypothetical protein
MYSTYYLYTSFTPSSDTIEKYSSFVTDNTLVIKHNAGFFSCCFVRLYKIIEFFKQNKKLPSVVDTSHMYGMYKKNNTDITFDFFEPYDNDITIDSNYNKDIIQWDEQFFNYKYIDYQNNGPFIKKYFTPSSTITNLSTQLLKKYNIQPEQCIGLYYRGTDKLEETLLDSFDSYYNKLQEVVQQHPNIQILLQTDSAPFIDYMKDKKLQSIIIKENTTSYTNKGIHNEKSSSDNYLDIQYLFATLLILSKCKYIICSSGNVSVWMMYYRQHADKVYQNINKEWLS